MRSDVPERGRKAEAPDRYRPSRVPVRWRPSVDFSALVNISCSKSTSTASGWMDGWMDHVNKKKRTL